MKRTHHRNSKRIKMQNFLKPQKTKNMVKPLIASIALAFAATTPAFASIEWQFNTSANPAYADAGNPAATASIHVGRFGAGWHNDWNLGSATGYWDLGKNGTVQLTIPNLANSSRSYNATLSIVQWVDGPL